MTQIKRFPMDWRSSPERFAQNITDFNAFSQTVTFEGFRMSQEYITILYDTPTPTTKIIIAGFQLEDPTGKNSRDEVEALINTDLAQKGALFRDLVEPEDAIVYAYELTT